MNIEEFHTYCMQKPGTEETFPFDEVTLVFKVMGKMYALCGLERIPTQINLKCDPERSVELREEYPDYIQGAFHMNKTHWNSVIIEDTIDRSLIMELIDHSYDLVVSKLPKKIKEELAALSK